MTGDPVARGRAADRSTYQVRALLFRDSDCWVAQCLEYDLATQAKRLKDLYYELEKLLMGQVVVAHHTGRQPFANLPAAPRRFLSLWDEAADLEPRTSEHLEVEEVERPEVQYRLADIA